MKHDCSVAQFPTRRDTVPSVRLQPARALRALQRLRADPHDTAQAFIIIDSLSGQAPLRLLARFQNGPAGRVLLAERPDLVSTLRDREALGRMPRGLLAEAYLAFAAREGITADGLVEASLEGRSREVDPNADLAFVRDRLRDTHDLWPTPAYEPLRASSFRGMTGNLELGAATWPKQVAALPD
ncbi:MAG: hypothetical protein JWN48_2955 [Myxococcaceae bacterium]|nr:hypothetical protein [Myxococcaceae bacterium]